MSVVTREIRKNLKYLTLLAKQYPGIQSVYTEIINLRAILNLPKGTEHFLSDLHGEHEAFTHILNNCSGVIREKMRDAFDGALSEEERAELCSLIYYPRQKLRQVKGRVGDMDAWYERTLSQLILFCKHVSFKYTRSKVRKAMPAQFSYIIDELLNDHDQATQSLYHQKILESILALSNADEFIVALAALIKRLAVDHLHIVGDIFDRGPRPDLVMDVLEDYHSVDIQWGNHDILWMGAAAGHPACVAAVMVNSVAYGNLSVLEEGYGINLRPLALFAEKTYGDSAAFAPRLQKSDARNEEEIRLDSQIHKAASVLLYKLEGQVVLRHPEYGMADRLLLDKINHADKTVRVGETAHPLLDGDLPTLDRADPYGLSQEEQQIIDGLTASFTHSQRLQRHIRFLYTRGNMYKCFNQNLLFHGCVPMEEDGSFTRVGFGGAEVGGKALLDRAEAIARTAYYGSGDAKRQAMDGMWYLWCGKDSPLFGRDRMTTFERRLIADSSTWTETKNPYYKHIQSEEACIRVLEEFGLSSKLSHIINGHVPVKVGKGESPVKGGGKLIVIDGGLCKAYQPQTGIAGYTLIYNSYALRLSAHRPFESVQKVVEENRDILSSTDVFETLQQRIRVMDTDIGQEISEQIYDLSLLLEAYKRGLL